MRTKDERTLAECLVSYCEDDLHNIVRCLLAVGVKPDSCDDNGRPALFMAAAYGSLRCLVLLLEAGADVHLTDPHGRTALHSASNNGHTLAIRQLIKSKAAVAATADDGVTPLMLAACKGHTEACEELVKAGASNAGMGCPPILPLHLAARGGHLAMIDLFLAARPGLDVKDDDGNTPLLYAATCDRLDAIRHLLRLGADANTICFGGNTPMMRAIQGGHFLATRELLQHSDVHITNDSGRNALHLCMGAMTSCACCCLVWPTWMYALWRA